MDRPAARAIQPADELTNLRPRAQAAVRWVLAIVFVIAGINHFRQPDGFIRIVPPQLPAPALLVAISGVAEIVGGLGILVPPVRQAAGWGLIALLIAVFPANIYMLLHDIPLGNTPIPRLLLWLRLPMQPLLMWVVWWSCCRPARANDG